MDIFDQAQEADAGFLRQSLEAQRLKMPKGESLSRCEECDSPIPEARRRLLPGIRLCVRCVEEIEKRERR